MLRRAWFPHTETGMIIGTIRIIPSARQRAAVVELLQRVQGPVRTQPGCAGCCVFEETGIEPAVVLVERWASEAALEIHIRSDDFRLVLGALELSSEVPEVSFEHVSRTEGLELIERVRM